MNTRYRSIHAGVGERLMMSVLHRWPALSRRPGVWRLFATGGVDLRVDLRVGPRGRWVELSTRQLPGVSG